MKHLLFLLLCFNFLCFENNLFAAAKPFVITAAIHDRLDEPQKISKKEHIKAAKTELKIALKKMRKTPDPETKKDNLGRAFLIGFLAPLLAITILGSIMSYPYIFGAMLLIGLLFKIFRKKRKPEDSSTSDTEKTKKRRFSRREIWMIVLGSILFTAIAIFGVVIIVTSLVVY